MRSFDDANAMQGNFPNFAQARNQMETWRSFYDAIGVQGNFPNFAQARNQMKTWRSFYDANAMQGNLLILHAKNGNLAKITQRANAF